MNFLFVSAFSPNGKESGANRLRKLAQAVRAAGHSVEWLDPPVEFSFLGPLGKVSVSLWILVRALRWARTHSSGWLLISLPPPWLLLPAYVLSWVARKKLILDFRDPLLNQEINPRGKIFQRTIAWLQSGVIHRARFVVVAAPMIGERIGVHPSKQITVLGGVSEEETRSLLQAPIPRKQNHVIYGGTFYGSRSPRLLLETLEEYSGPLSFDFYVSFNDPGEEAEVRARTLRNNLKERVHLYGLQPRKEFLQQVRGASVGLIITHSAGSDYAIPGKIFDYLTAGVVPWVITEDRGLLDFLDTYKIRALVTRQWTKAALLEGLSALPALLEKRESKEQLESLMPLFDSQQVQGLIRALESKNP